MGNFICFANPRFMKRALEVGTFGNFGEKSTNQLWSILRDLIAIKPGDTVFFYETEIKAFHGVYESISEPYFCNDSLFSNTGESFPFRFCFRRKLNFPNTVPSFEFIHLIDRKVVWSLAALEKDPTGPFRSIVNISNQESSALIELLYKYNIGIDPTAGIISTSPIVFSQRAEAIDIINKKIWPNTDTAIDFNLLPVGGPKRSPQVAYEFALQAYLSYHLARKTTQAKTIMGVYNESLTEVPLSAAEPRRMDIVCTYQHNGTSLPFFYRLIELKPKGGYSRDRLGQLLGYLRIFSQKKGVEFGDVGGSVIAHNFDEETLKYIEERAKIEVEKPVQLISYKLDLNGQIDFRIIV